MEYKEEIGDWLEGLLLMVTFLLVMIMLIVIIIFSPFTAILNWIKKAIAMIGLDSEQRELLVKLSGHRISFLREIARELSENEDYSQAQMRSSAEGYAVLSAQDEVSKWRKAEIEKLIDACRKTGIAKWRIWLVKP